MNVTVPRLIARLHHACPPWMLLLLFGPLLYLVLLVAEKPFLSVATGRLPAYVFTGKLFTERFDIVHAGSALDQPTIGKWLLWFSVLATLAVPVIVLARWLADRSTRFRYWTFAIPVLVICVLILCVLLGPLCMLIQYVYWMGFTPKRAFGLSFSLAALVLLPWFLRWSLRRPCRRHLPHAKYCLVHERPKPTMQCMKAHQTNLARWRAVAAVALLVTLAGCGKPSERSQVGSRDHLLGWFKLPGRNDRKEAISGYDTLIPVFKRDGTYYSVCRGAEVPLKKCPEGLEWAAAPSSTDGAKIGWDASSGTYCLAVMDSLASNFTDGRDGVGEKEPMTRINRPKGLLNIKARRPRTNDEFIGWYQPLWFPGVRIQIRRDGDRYVSQWQDFSGPEPGSWKTHAKPLELTTLPDQLGFTGFERDNSIRLVYNDTLKRFEIMLAGKETNLSVIRMPLARVPAPASPECGRAPSPTARIGIPAWH